MLGSASGPLGALLLIAPLAAIPVFAIMGVPQFTSVVASSGDEDEFSDLGDSTAALESERSETPSRNRTDDLFAPLADSTAPSDVARSARGTGKASATAPAISGRESRSKSTLPPAEALDNWEVRPGPADAVAGRSTDGFPGKMNPVRDKSDDSDALEIPVDGLEEGQVSPEGFSPELLKPSPQRPRAVGRGTDGVNTRTSPPSRLESIRTKPADVAGPSRRSEAFPDAMSEQSGWQAAARRLKELGIRKYHLESQIEDQTFTFQCAFAAPDNPRVVRRFEADADNPLEAVQKVLTEIDDWRNRDEIAAVPREE